MTSSLPHPDAWRRRALLTPLLTLALALPGLLSSCAEPPRGPRDEALTRRLERDGYVVQAGRVVPFRPEDCVQLPSCFGNNATSPYALWWLPEAPGADAPVPSVEGLPPDDQGRTPAWTLRADEAVVYVGRTSPEAAYFSYAPYLFSRVDPGGERVSIFASLSDAVNVTHFPDGAFDRDIAVIVTADVELEARLRRDLRRTGLADADIVTFGLSAEQLRLGTGADADVVMMLQRFALFSDPAEGEAYLDAMPASVMRVTPAAAVSGSTFAIPERAERASGDNENVLLEGLDALEAAVRAGGLGDSPSSVPILSASAITLLLRPGSCIDNFANCLGEVSDTVYSAGPLSGVVGAADPLYLGDAPGERLVVIGVNHADFGRALYSNLVVMNAGRLAGVVAMNHAEMRGSAQRFIGEHPDAEYLYAVSIMRDCAGEPYCVELPVGELGADLDDAISLAFRAYVQPGASVSPAPRELLVERVLHFVP